MVRVWEALGRDGRVIVQVRCEYEDIARAAIDRAIDADPSAAPEGYYVGDDGRDLSRDCICSNAVTGMRHLRGCVINRVWRAAYDAAGRRMCGE
jgi:hypothetical protein